MENLFEKVMMENFPNLRREKVTQIEETERVPSKRNPKKAHCKTHNKKNGKIPRQTQNVKGTGEKLEVTYKGAL